MAEVLIVDDEAAFASGTARFLEMHGHPVRSVGTLAEARETLAERLPQVVLLDLMLPDGNGLELFDVLERNPPCKIIIVTGHSGVKSRISGMGGHGVTYLKKPIEADALLEMLDAFQRVESRQPSGETARAHFGLLVGESEPMQSLYRLIRQVAPTDSTVLIQGESGTGKELVAEAIHRVSKRKGPFIPVNAGGLIKDLVSSQLFGHEKGSFTGAGNRHAGFFERAHEGTLFMDEITEMRPELQTHLLRVLETRKILRLGSEQDIPIDTRVLAATNRDPVQAVRNGKLREDLFFRLRVFPIVLPPLRERKGDITLLAEHFLAVQNQRHGTQKSFAAGALGKFERHAWPGNVRELMHIVHRGFIMAEGDLVHAPERFDEELPGAPDGLSVGRSIADVEKDLIISTLAHFAGDKKATAAALGVSLKTLYNRLNAYSD